MRHAQAHTQRAFTPPSLLARETRTAAEHILGLVLGTSICYDILPAKSASRSGQYELEYTGFWHDCAFLDGILRGGGEEEICGACGIY